MPINIPNIPIIGHNMRVDEAADASSTTGHVHYTHILYFVYDNHKPQTQARNKVANCLIYFEYIRNYCPQLHVTLQSAPRRWK
jgi:hypothetical protein